MILLTYFIKNSLFFSYAFLPFKLLGKTNMSIFSSSDTVLSNIEQIALCNLFNIFNRKLLVKVLVTIKLLRSEEHTSELQSRFDFVCRLLLEKKKINSRCCT